MCSCTLVYEIATPFREAYEIYHKIFQFFKSLLERKGLPTKCHRSLSTCSFSYF